MKTRDLLEKAITHVIQQGVPSVSQYGKCFYRGKDGLKCAVGALISDENYNIDLEHNPASAEIVVEAINKSCNVRLTGKVADYLDHVQESHDDSKLSKNFVSDFKNTIKGKVYDGFLPKYCLEFIK